MYSALFSPKKYSVTLFILYISLVYSLVYAIFINPVYGVLQMFVALTIPLLKMYGGERGNWNGMKWFFYAYYPLHLVVCGLIRIALYGNVGVMIGG